MTELCLDNAPKKATEPYDIAIVDLMLPSIDGLTLIEMVRKQHFNIPA